MSKHFWKQLSVSYGEEWIPDQSWQPIQSSITIYFYGYSYKNMKITGTHDKEARVLAVAQGS